MGICNIVEFNSAPELISYIKRHGDRIIKEKITAFYIVSDEGNCTKDSIIFEFETFAVRIEYLYHSALSLTVVDRESFQEGELTFRIYGDRVWNGRKLPFDVPPYAPRLYKHIEGIEISKFNHPFEGRTIRMKNRLYSGDYFHKISLLFEDTKFTIFSEPASYEGRMSFKFEKLDEKESCYLDLKDVEYEKIL